FVNELMLGLSRVLPLGVGQVTGLGDKQTDQVRVGRGEIDVRANQPAQRVRGVRCEAVREGELAEECLCPPSKRGVEHLDLATEVVVDARAGNADGSRYVFV